MGNICLCSFWFIFLQGAGTVHFQDLSAETIRCTTVPNVLANLEQARERQSRQPESSLTPSRQTLAPSVHFYAGDWEELPTVLSVVGNDVSEVTTGMSLSFSEEDFMDGCSSQDGSIIGQDSSSRRSRKLSGSRAWERASEADQGEGGYDVILLTEIPYSVTSLKKLYLLIKKVSFLLSSLSFYNVVLVQCSCYFPLPLVLVQKHYLLWFLTQVKYFLHEKMFSSLKWRVNFLFYLIRTFFLDDQCLRPPYGVVYLATKKNYVGFNNAARHLRSLVDEEGIFGAHLIKEMTDRDIWKFFLKWTEGHRWSNYPAKLIYWLYSNMYKRRSQVLFFGFLVKFFASNK